MVNLNFNKDKITRLLSLFFLCIFVISAQGCEPLRKKFTRKKKESKKDEVIPVLTPIDYPAAMNSPKDKYAYQYSLWKVWLKYSLESIEKSENDKRTQYYLERGLVVLQELNALLDEPKQSDLSGLIRSYQKVMSDFDQPEAFRNSSTMDTKLKSIDRQVRQQFNLTAVEPYLIQPAE